MLWFDTVRSSICRKTLSEIRFRVHILVVIVIIVITRVTTATEVNVPLETNFQPILLGVWIIDLFIFYIFFPFLVFFLILSYCVRWWVMATLTFGLVIHTSKINRCQACLYRWSLTDHKHGSFDLSIIRNNAMWVQVLEVRLAWQLAVPDRS